MPVLTLVGGPFDGDTIKLRPEQTAVIVPESADGALHRYEVAADGRAHYASAVAEDRAERLCRALWEFHVEQMADGDTENWNPWELLTPDEQNYTRKEVMWVLERLGEPRVSQSDARLAPE